VGAVALTTGEVDDAQPRHAQGDPLVHRQVAAKPVVLLRHVGQRALPGELQWRDAVGLVALEIELLAHADGSLVGRHLDGTPRFFELTAPYTLPPAMGGPPTAEQIRVVNTRYHDGAAAGYDAKW